MEASHAPTRPTWWTEARSAAWERVRDGARRDWETQRDTGHVARETRDLGSTMKAGAWSRALPAEFLGDWEDVEISVAFGHAARRAFGSGHPGWDPEIEALLRRDWEASHEPADQNWGDAKAWIRQGYEGPG